MLPLKRKLSSSINLYLYRRCCGQRDPPPDHLSGRLSIQGVSSTLRRTIDSDTTVGSTRGQPDDHPH
ncbi:hypothetical protein A2U01_0042514 [Trifolium medium]|uniref:Uncharacterized protein n=1 Tax=Trifolium medium TaxID=97028 RepID=A0A392QBY4_9FABA|nr:hypothetical protein [Trifolium medium]